MRYLKKLLICCFIALLAFTAAALFMFKSGVYIPDSLIVAYFGAFGIETVLCAIIKITEQKEGAERDKNKVPGQKPDVYEPDEDHTQKDHCTLNGDKHGADNGETVG